MFFTFNGAVFNRLKICIFSAAITPWGVELWNQFPWNQCHIYPVDFNSMGCRIVKPVSLKSISYLSSGFQVHGVSTVKPISLKSISYLFGFQLWNQLHWNQFHIYLKSAAGPGKECMYVCSYVCARVRVCVCVSVYVGGKGCFMGRGSYLLHIPHIICIYIYTYTCVYIYIYMYILLSPPCCQDVRWKSADA